MQRTALRGLKRLAALMMSLLVIMVQLASPMMALASEWATYPTVTIYYQLSQEEAPFSLPIYATVRTDGQVVYWATLPVEAFYYPISVDVFSDIGDPALSFTPAAGSFLVTGEATDLTSAYTTIEQYRDGILEMQWPLYVSSLPIPEEEPTEPDYGDGDTGDGSGDTGDGSGDTGDNDPWYPDDNTGDGSGDTGDGSGDTGDNDPWYPDVNPDDIVPDQDPEPFVPQETSIERYGITDREVNFRMGASTDTSIAAGSVPKNTYIWIYSELTNEKGEQWYHIRYDTQSGSMECYVMVENSNGTLASPLSQEDSDRRLAALNDPPQVLVNYVDSESQEILYFEYYSCPVDTDTTIYFKPDVVPGATLDSDEAVTVSVDGFGVADPASVTFSVTTEAKSAEIMFQFVDASTGNTFQTSSQPFAAGEYFASDHASEQSGYTFDYAEPASFTVERNGTASTNAVTLYYQPISRSADINLHFVDAEYRSIADSTTRTLEPRDYASADFAIEISGYTFEYADPASFTVNQDGTATNIDINLIYAFVPQSADITFHFVDAEYRSIADSATRTLEPRDYTSADFAIDISGYTFDHADPASFTVNQDGTATNIDINLIYAFVPQSAEVTFRFTDGSNEIAPPDTQTLGANTYYSADFAQQIANYAFQSANPETFTVNADGTASVNEVVLTYAFIEQPASITFRFTDGTNDIASPDTQTLGANIYTSADFAQQIANYSFQSANPETFTVSNDGTASVNEVVLTYTFVEQPASITFRFTDGTNDIASPDTQTLGANTYYSADFAQQIANYSFQSANPETFTVSNDGTASVNEVVLTYTFIEQPASITFRFTDGTNDIASPDTQTLGANTYYSADFAQQIANYAFQSANPETFTVNADGTASVNEVTLTYTPVAVKGHVAVNIVGEGNESLGGFTREPEPGTYPVSDFLITIADYEFVSADSTQVVVDTNGVTTPATLTLTYAPIQTEVEAEVTFLYVSTSGRNVETSLTMRFTPDTYSVDEYAAAPEGYTLQSVSADSFTVNADGSVTPSNTITFTYAEPQQTALVAVEYVNAIGEVFAAETREFTAVGTFTILPDTTYVPQGYEPVRQNQSSLVNISSTYVATPATVQFAYYDSNQSVAISVHYRNSVDNTVVATDTVRIPLNTTMAISPDASVLPTGYELAAGNSAVNIAVSAAGVPSQTDVYFRCTSVTDTQYVGYALTTRETFIRTQPSSSDRYLLTTVPANTLLYLNGQPTTTDGIEWTDAQTVLGTIYKGYAQMDTLRTIGNTEAAAIIEEYNQEISSQGEGFYITVVSNAPLRAYFNAYAEIRSSLSYNTVIYVTTQQRDGQNRLWHFASYNGVSGYIQDNQIRKLTTAEVEAYLESNQNPVSPAPTTTATYNPNGASSYGYVSTNNVNFRATPTGTRLRTLNQYAFALILGTREVNGVTWYNVNYGGTIGWIHGDYFHQMSLTELTNFLNSSEYTQGIQNNASTSSSGSTSSGSTSGSTGSATQGNISSVEDWNVGTWQNTGVTTQTSYAPFNPYATPVATNTAEASASPEASPTPTFVIGTMIPITYEDESRETQTSTVPWGLIGGAVVLIGAAGGVYAYALNQNKRRKAAAARAAAGRRTAGSNASGSASSSTSPYARRAVAAPPTGTSTTPNPYSTPTNPYSTPTQNPYSAGSVTGTSTPISSTPVSGSIVNPYSRPATGTDAFDPLAAPIAGSTRTESSATDSSAAQNPFAKPAPILPTTPSATSETPTAPASTVANPYARPINLGGAAAPQSSATPEAKPSTTARRSTRMQRYHAAEQGEEGTDE